MHPPGFGILEALTPLQRQEVATGQPKVATRGVTRSQTRRIIESGVRCQRGLNMTSSGDQSVTRRSKATRSSSSSTTESIAKLAKESLEMGSLLGLKIRDKKEVALK